MDLVLSEGAPVYGAITDNWPTIEPYFNETGKWNDMFVYSTCIVCVMTPSTGVGAMVCSAQRVGWLSWLLPCCCCIAVGWNKHAADLPVFFKDDRT